MKQLHPEFAPREPSKWVWWMLGVLAITCLSVWSGAWSAYRHASHLATQTGALAQSASVPRAALLDSAPPLYVESAREMLAERDSRWAETFHVLEAVAMPGVTPVQLDVDARRHRAQVEVEAGSHDVVLRYLEALNAGFDMPEWALISTRLAAQGGPVSAILVRNW